MTPQASIAHYRLTGKLGEGGMGGVWRAVDTKLSRDVAVKISHPKAGSPEPFLKTPDNEQYPMFSPDGRWIAYMSPESGTSEIYVRPFRGAGKWQAALGGGVRLKWSRGARQLFYNDSSGKLMVVDYTVSGDEFKPGKPQPWTDIPIHRTSGAPNFDVAPDGKRLLVFPDDAAEAPPRQPTRHLPAELLR